MFAFIFVVGIIASNAQRDRQREPWAVAMISLLYSKGSFAEVTVKHVFDVNDTNCHFHNRCYPQTSAFGTKYKMYSLELCLMTCPRFSHTQQISVFMRWNGCRDWWKQDNTRRSQEQSCSKGPGGGRRYIRGTKSPLWQADRGAKEEDWCF